MPDEPATLVAAKPLYAQVRDQLTRRLVSGEWTPGMLIPSEQELARQLNVSQGTVRKALDAMTMDNLLVRRQGRGTFVAQPEDPRQLFQFFRLSSEKQQEFPESQVLKMTRVSGTKDVVKPLGLSAGDPVIRIERVRSMGGAPIINEVLWLPADRFAGLVGMEHIPNNIYKLLSSKWGVTIARADEQLHATLASAQDALRLSCPQGHPLIAIQRVAYDLEGRPVELRQSRCLTDNVRYSVTLR
ncbi:GntR family transcriptional regulator [Paracoccus benzoatiresistens]|uniref:GntR family transcriptional regulator n=1 Tax=Paracoccus benzoatiresistens TaxID=2997341 RepID=A0ABT4JB24_9RHOB|nr:GntR family transcriptional regulator [Paracoccus sp. EF6]MCZ0964277.1 GntR family transcriptional regulator [Paracoccus sp. EF6]